MGAAAFAMLYAWPFAVVLLFGVIEPKKATAWAFALSWCFLPVAEIPINGLPDYTKTSATAYGVLAGTAIFHLRSLLGFRPSFADVPVVVWCLAPFFSSVANGLGVLDGQSEMLVQTMAWGMPYFIGRVHFHRLTDLESFFWPLVGCGLLYVPLCLYEVRMSPQLHAMFYGFMQHSFFQTMRGGGWRPMVFMHHGLQLGMWMGIASLFALTWGVFAKQRYVRIFGFEMPSWIIVLMLVGTFVLVKSTGAIILCAAGFGVLVACRVVRSNLPGYLLPLGCIVYIVVRTMGLWDGAEFVQYVASFSEERAQSLQFRIDNEDMLARKAIERPAFGWGGWGRARVYDEEGRDISVTDGGWIIALGNNGIVGVASRYLTALIGPMLMLLVCPPPSWKERPECAIGAAIAVACLVEAADSLPNDHQLPMLTMALGICVSVFHGERRALRLLSGDNDDPIPQSRVVDVARDQYSLQPFER